MMLWALVPQNQGVSIRTAGCTPRHLQSEQICVVARPAFDKEAILRKCLPYERLDQLTVDILTGVR